MLKHGLGDEVEGSPPRGGAKRSDRRLPACISVKIERSAEALQKPPLLTSFPSYKEDYYKTFWQQYEESVVSGGSKLINEVTRISCYRRVPPYVWYCRIYRAARCDPDHLERIKAP